MAVTGPLTGFKMTDPNTGNTQDLGTRYVSKEYILEVYPSLVPSKKTPGLWTCGYNFYGNLGNGTTTSYSSPIQVGSLTNWKQVVPGKYVTSYIKTDGTLWSCGYNLYGQIGNGNNSNYSSPIQVGSLTNWKQISIGNIDVKVIKTDGTLWTWGYPSFGNLGTNDDTTPYSSPVQIGSLTDWKQVDSTFNTSAAIKTDGTLWAWGKNDVGQLGNGTVTHYSSPIQVGTLTDWKQVSLAAGNFVSAIKTDGTLWGWGDNYYGHLGNGSSGNLFSSPIQIGSLTNWKQVSVGQHGGGAVKTDGTLWMWGNGYYGENAQGDTTNYSSPIQVGTLTNWKQVSCGYLHISALKTDGTLWAWGRNQHGQLGTGDTTNYYSPIQIGTLTTWKSTYSSKHYFLSAAIKDGYL